MNTFYFSIVVFRADWSFELCPKLHLFWIFTPIKLKIQPKMLFEC